MIGRKKDIQAVVWLGDDGVIHIASESGGRWRRRISNDPSRSSYHRGLFKSLSAVLKQKSNKGLLKGPVRVHR